MAAAVDEGDDAASALVLADAAAAVDGAMPKTKVGLLLLVVVVLSSFFLLSLISLFPAGTAVVIALAPLALAKPNPEEGLVAPPKLNPAPKPVPLAEPNPENDAADPNTKAALVVSVADVGAVIVSLSSWVEGVDEGSPTAAATDVTADAADTDAVVVAVNVTAANGLLLAAFGGASLLLLSTIGAAVAEFAVAAVMVVAAGRRTFTILRCAKTCAEARANDVPLLLSLSSSSDSSPCAAASRW